MGCLTSAVGLAARRSSLLATSRAPGTLIVAGSAPIRWAEDLENMSITAFAGVNAGIPENTGFRRFFGSGC